LYDRVSVNIEKMFNARRKLKAGIDAVRMINRMNRLSPFSNPSTPVVENKDFNFGSGSGSNATSPRTENIPEANNEPK
jgi:hypothetical protein